MGPKLYFGHRDSGAIYQVGTGYDDGGEPYSPIILSNPSLPSGTEGENVFSAVYLTLAQREPPLPGDPVEEVSIFLTPFVDGVEKEQIEFLVRMQPINAGFPPRRIVIPYEIGLSEAYTRGGVEVGRNALRGTTFQLKLELPATELQVIEAKVEYDPVRESRTHANA